MKKFLTILLALALLTGGVAWYFVTYHLDETIERVIESAGGTSFGPSVQVGSVKTSIRDGSLTISSLTVANPPGYDNKHAISFNEIVAAVDYDSLDIDRVIIENPEVIIEEKGGKSNFSDLLEGLENAGAKGRANGDRKEPIITVRHFRMNQSSAAFLSESRDADSEIQVGTIELNNIKGTPRELANIIAREILGNISAAAAAEIIKAQARKKAGPEKEAGKESAGDNLKVNVDQGEYR